MPAKAKWAQLADGIRAQIESGELAPGAKLPPTAQLKQEHNVSATVVRQAISCCRCRAWWKACTALASS